MAYTTADPWRAAFLVQCGHAMSTRLSDHRVEFVFATPGAEDDSRRYDSDALTPARSLVECIKHVRRVMFQPSTSRSGNDADDHQR
jgi:hypothetical protein